MLTAIFMILLQFIYFAGLCAFMWIGWKEMQNELEQAGGNSKVGDIIRIQFVQDIVLYLAWPVTAPLQFWQAKIEQDVLDEKGGE